MVLVAHDHRLVHSYCCAMRVRNNDINSNVQICNAQVSEVQVGSKTAQAAMFAALMASTAAAAIGASRKGLGPAMYGSLATQPRTGHACGSHGTRVIGLPFSRPQSRCWPC